MIYLDFIIDLPLGPVAHRQNELSAYKENTGKSENNENVSPNSVTERVKLRVGQRTCYEVEGEVKVGLDTLKPI